MSQNLTAKASPKNLDELIEQLCQYLDEHKVRFSSGQLDDAGKLFERYDYQTARMVVEGKDDRNSATLAYVLSEVYSTSHRLKLPPDRGSFLIRHLNQICKHRRSNP